MVCGGQRSEQDRVGVGTDIRVRAGEWHLRTGSTRSEVLQTGFSGQAREFRIQFVLGAVPEYRRHLLLQWTRSSDHEGPK